MSRITQHSQKVFLNSCGFQVLFMLPAVQSVTTALQLTVTKN